MFLHPFEGQSLIAQTCISDTVFLDFRTSQETEKTQTVLNSNKDYGAVGFVYQCIARSSLCISSIISTTVNFHHDWKAIRSWVMRHEHIENQAVLALIWPRRIRRGCHVRER